MVNSKRRLVIRLLIVLATFLILTGCGAPKGGVQTMLQNLSGSYDALWKLATAAAYVTGFAFFFKALYNLKIYGELRTMMASNASLKTPLTYLFAGTMLIWSPHAFQIVNQTLFARPDILKYAGGNIGAGWTTAGTIAVIRLVQFIGLLSFIRGWMYIARAGEQGGQPGNVGKGFTHIIGGVLAINIIQFKDVIQATFGF